MYGVMLDAACSEPQNIGSFLRVKISEVDELNKEPGNCLSRNLGREAELLSFQSRRSSETVALLSLMWVQ